MNTPGVPGRRGSCPSVSVPMQTGDGLLARLVPHGPIGLGQLTTLCAAAEEHGNGIIEVTQRGNLQIRGLSEASAPKFAEVIASLQIGVEGAPSVLTSPLLGLDSGEPFQSANLSTSLVSALLRELEDRKSVLQALAPKVSVLIDGGGRLHLDALNGDIRLVAQPHHSLGTVLQLSLAGTASTATLLGYVTADHAPAAVTVLLEMLANKGPAARGRDLTSVSAILDVRRSLGRYLTEGVEPAPSRPPAEPVGTHTLKDDVVAVGFALPFGHTTATALRRIVEIAADQGVASMRPAPGRALLAIPLTRAKADTFRRLAALENFIVDSRDPRRQVVTCVGAPACTCAQLPTRQLAADVAVAAQSWAGTSKIVHLAGCSKGCAHPDPAALTIVGPDRIILNGRASDTPQFTISAAGLIAVVTRLCGNS